MIFDLTILSPACRIILIYGAIHTRACPESAVINPCPLLHKHAFLSSRVMAKALGYGKPLRIRRNPPPIHTPTHIHAPVLTPKIVENQSRSDSNAADSVCKCAVMAQLEMQTGSRLQIIALPCNNTSLPPTSAFPAFRHPMM